MPRQKRCKQSRRSNEENIETEPLAKIDYVEAVDALSMAPVEKLEGTCMLAMAVYIGKTRLIDNTLINE